jgi:HTH-type transcriptional regulator / antitoxin HigA
MGKRIQNQYIPDIISPPGETLLDTIEALEMTQANLAERTGRSKKMINEIIKGKAPITPKMAIDLERVLGVPASFWNNREHNYRENLARIEEDQRLSAQVKWLDTVPVKDMVKWGWIKKYQDKVSQLQEVLSFFRIASPTQLATVAEGLDGQVNFRKSYAFKVDNTALMVWLRKGEIDARDIQCKPFDDKVFRAALEKIRGLTTVAPQVFQKQLVEICSECGVAVVFVPELPKTRVSGATRWLSPDKALIQLSLRYKANDHLWFSFFHEAGHILKHGKKEIFIEDSAISMDQAKEDEANLFAADMLIPRQDYNRFIKKGCISKNDIHEFAFQLGIAPGIVVGRLQHDEHLPITHCNDLKMRFEWAKS